MTSPAPLPSRLIGAADRIPDSLALLRGPSTGRVSLPVRLAWSGLTEFDVTDPRQRLTLYRTLLDCGQRDDIIRYANAGLWRRDWPRIKRLTARRLVALWERRIPELAG
ncbi:hypothetical protein K7640_09840 [Micromonospora sp. PLK6-60]|uniref:hypothetical protein n=1 Tax=Micromonospora sp. PLK6-60 TaxID=2873383 RepID=UPI001CA75EFA|nr:hypothetical protein [Micromonospora sp. PLK6-60]MBY8872139.1 hypothetical protein [Micromonospora sp. PLK6-60]